VSGALTRVVRLDLDAFAAASGTHPELIRRLVALGILDATRDPAGNLWFAPGELAALARIQRLRAGFALNYAAIGLVTDLLDRITTLEAALRRSGRPGR
jgi:chaperone modulatory protein CbpM